MPQNEAVEGLARFQIARWPLSCAMHASSPGLAPAANWQEVAREVSKRGSPSPPQKRCSTSSQAGVISRFPRFPLHLGA